MLWLLLVGAASVTASGLGRCQGQGAESTAVMLSPRLAESQGLGDGAGWRRLWADTLCLPVATAERIGGGLGRYVAESGRLSSVVTARNPGDSAFRILPLDRDPISATLPQELLGSTIDRFLRDLVVTVHPTAPLAAAALYRQVGLDAIQPELVVLRADPDPAHLLDSLRGRPVWLERAPDLDGKPFGRFSRVLTTEELLDEVRRDPTTRIAVERYLAARLVDIVIGDRDRGPKHWLWGLESTGGHDGRWTPIATRQEEAFLRAKGWSGRILNQYEPGYQAFGPEIPDLADLVDRGYDLDRFLLVRLDRATWDSVAGALGEALTAERIEAAVARLPESQRVVSGSTIVTGIEGRRSLLPSIVDEYFRLMNQDPDIELSDASERVTIRRSETGDVEVRVEAGDLDAFDRRFHPAETGEVRVHLEGGQDSVYLEGAEHGGVGVRITSRSGTVALAREGSDARKVVLYADRDSVNMAPPDAIRLVPRAEGRRMRWVQDDRSPVPMDWGSSNSPLAELNYNGDLGLVVGAGFQRQWRGFAQARYRQQLRGSFAFASRPSGVRVQAAFERRDVLRNIHLLASAKATGIDVVRYFGFGNETRITEDDDFYRVEAHELSLGLAAEVSSHPELVFTVGPLLSLGTTDTAGTETLVGTDQPYGSGQFHFVGIQSRFDYAGLRSVRDGLRLRTSLEAVAAPGWMDVDRGGFTRVSGEGRLLWGFGSTRRLVLATRVGGAVLSGSVPFRLSARIGGPLTLRGYDTDRFSGDRAAAYGAVEARVRVLRFHINFILSDLGFLAFTDAGRVWRKGESSSEIHTGFGGGLWAAPTLGWLPGIDEVVARLDVAHSNERTIVSVGTGFRF